jgi:pimeloyl-ACP methyl ester carboxylesterase
MAMDAADLMVRVADGVRLHVRRWPGLSANPPFLLVHGLSSNARLWDGVAVRLATAGYPVYAVDLRSHGESERPPTGYDTATAATDLAALSRALHVSPAIAAGQSWGGNVVVELAAEHPDLVAALALVDGGWSDLASQYDSWEECEQALRPPEVDRLRETDLLAFIRRSHPDWEEWAVRATAANFRVDNSGRLTRRLPIPEHMQIVRSMWDDPPSRYHPRIRVPALLAPAVPEDHESAARKTRLVEKAAAALPDSTVREYPGADHDLHAQQPTALAKDLLALASRVSPP